jgi:hypothetical protein
MQFFTRLQKHVHDLLLLAIVVRASLLTLFGGPLSAMLLAVTSCCLQVLTFTHVSLVASLDVF